MWRRLAVVVVILSCGRAHADRRAALDYHGACGERALRDRTRELVGHEPFSAGGVPRIRVEVTQGRRVTAIVRIFDSGPVRRLEGATCDEALDSIALVIAMVLAQPVAPPQQRRDGEHPPATISRVERADERQVVDEPPASPSGVEPMFGGAVSTRGQLGWSLGLQLRGSSKSIELAVEGRADHEVDRGAARVAVAQRGGSIAPCVRHGRFATCGLVAAGAITGRNPDRGTTATSPFAALGARIAWEQPLTRTLAVRAQIAAQVAVTKTRFRVDEMLVWESPRGELWSGIVMIARFP